jgi:predicted MFS family arabinose efflux permease
VLVGDFADQLLTTASQIGKSRMRINPIAPTTQLAVGWFTMFIVGTELFVVSPLLPFLAADLHLSTAMAGWSVAVFSVTYMLSSPLLGQFSDRIGRRRVLVCSLLAFAAANLITASATSLPSLLAARLSAGAAAAGISPSVYALTVGAAPADRRATRLGLVVSGLVVSLALGAPTGALAGASLGWASVFIGLACLSVLLAWLNFRVWPKESCPAERSQSRASHPLAVRALIRRLTPTVVWSMGLYGVYTYLGTGLVAAGFSTGQTAQAILSYGCGAIAGVLLGGRVADRLGVKFTTGASLAGLCACFVLLRLALDTGVLVEPALGVSAAMAQLFFPAQQVGLVNDFPSRRGTALAWNNSALFFGISLGSLVGGVAVAFGNFDANLTISASIALLGCLINGVVLPGPVTLSVRRGKISR